MKFDDLFNNIMQENSSPYYGHGVKQEDTIIPRRTSKAGPAPGDENEPPGLSPTHKWLKKHLEDPGHDREYEGPAVSKINDWPHGDPPTGDDLKGDWDSEIPVRKFKLSGSASRRLQKEKASKATDDASGKEFKQGKSAEPRRRHSTPPKEPQKIKGFEAAVAAMKKTGKDAIYDQRAKKWLTADEIEDFTPPEGAEPGKDEHGEDIYTLPTKKKKK